MQLLVVYDVNTETRQGRRRLRQAAKVCLGFGHRVQKSVFECSLAAPQVDRLTRALEAVVDPRADSLRVYRLADAGRSLLCAVGGVGRAPREPAVVP